LGWSPGGDQEMITLKSAIKKFSVKRINKSAAAFSLNKLRWFNAQYIKHKDDQALADFMTPLLLERKAISKNFNPDTLKKIIGLYKNRMADLQEFLERTDYVINEEWTLDPEIKTRLKGDEVVRYFGGLAGDLEGLKGFDRSSAEQAFRAFAEHNGIKTAGLVHPVRVALTGSDVGPGLFETMEVLGQKRTVERLRSIAA